MASGACGDASGCGGGQILRLVLHLLLLLPLLVHLVDLGRLCRVGGSGGGCFDADFYLRAFFFGSSEPPKVDADEVDLARLECARLGCMRPGRGRNKSFPAGSALAH